MSESIVLLVLGACWVAYLGWYWRENRRTSTERRDGIRTFSSGLGSLGGSISRAPRPGAAAWSSTLMPRTPEAASRRRREVAVSLFVLCVITLFAAVALGPVALAVHVLADLTLVAYGFAAIQRRNAAAEHELKVTMLYPDGRAPVAPARRAVNG